MKIRETIIAHKSLVQIFGFFTSSRLLIFLVGWLSSLVVLKSKWYFNPQSTIDLFLRWDSGWYLSIVQNGYFYVPGEESSVAFFPLYPSLVKIFSFSYLDARITGFVLSNVALFLAMIYLFRLINLDYEDKTISLNSVIFALIFPASFFFSIFYSESLFFNFLQNPHIDYDSSKAFVVFLVLGLLQNQASKYENLNASTVPLINLMSHSKRSTTN